MLFEAVRPHFIGIWVLFLFMNNRDDCLCWNGVDFFGFFLYNSIDSGIDGGCWFGYYAVDNGWAMEPLLE